MQSRAQKLFISLGISLTTFVTLAGSAHARGRGAFNGGGGGDEIVAEFVSSAGVLLKRVPFDERDRNAIITALAVSEIVTVDVLKDVNGNPVEDAKNLIAYSWPGYIQLKNARKVSPGDVEGSVEDSWETRFKSGQSLAHFVIHELLRASGVLDQDGLSIDEGFRLSITKYGLDQFNTINLRTRALTIANILRDRGDIYCGDLANSSKLFNGKFMVDIQSQCKETALMEREFAYSILARHRENSRAIGNELGAALRNFCSLVGGSDLTSKNITYIRCKQSAEAKFRLVQALLEEDFSAFDVLQDDAMETARNFAPFHGQQGKLYTITVSGLPKGDDYVSYTRSFVDLMGALSGQDSRRK